jgi:hypothetical protein
MNHATNTRNKTRMISLFMAIHFDRHRSTIVRSQSRSMQVSTAKLISAKLKTKNLQWAPGLP